MSSDELNQLQRNVKIGGCNHFISLPHGDRFRVAIDNVAKMLQSLTFKR